MGTRPTSGWLRRPKGQTWYATITIPEDLRPIFGKVRFKQSLKTENRAEAERLSLPIVSAWKQQIEEARRTGRAPTGTPMPLMKEALAWQSADVVSSTRCPVTAEDLALERAEAIEAQYGTAKAREFYAVATGQATPIDQHLEAYLSSRDVGARYLAEVRAIVKGLMAWGASNVEDIDRQRAKAYFGYLLGTRGLALKTVRTKYRSALSTYWAWLDNEGLIPDHLSPKVWLDVALPKPSEKTVRQSQKRAYAVEDVRRLLEVLRKTEAGLAEFALAAAVTGMRLSEIAALTTTAFDRNKEGILFLRVTDAKTKAGYRTVPIVTALEPIIQERIQAAEKTAHGLLWPDAGENKYGERGTTYSKRFGRVKNDLGYGRNRDFHSFRRFVYTQLEYHGIPKMTISRLLGHEVGGMADVYSEGTTDLGRLKTALEEVAAEVLGCGGFS